MTSVEAFLLLKTTFSRLQRFPQLVMDDQVDIEAYGTYN